MSFRFCREYPIWIFALFPSNCIEPATIFVAPKSFVTSRNRSAERVAEDAERLMIGRRPPPLIANLIISSGLAVIRMCVAVRARDLEQLVDQRPQFFVAETGAVDTRDDVVHLGCGSIWQA